MPHNTSERVSFDEIHSRNFVVRIARTKGEIEAAQSLRYQVFYDEMKGTPSAEMRKISRDFDEFDEYCDHLLIIDTGLQQSESRIVGTYRLLRRSRMHDLKGFYSEARFDISALKNEDGEILELGRACIDAHYRNRSVIQLLLRGIGVYIQQYDVKLLFGAANFFGTDITKHTLPLSYLYHYHLAPLELRPVPLPGQYVEMNLIAKECIDVQEAMAMLPALIKGYLRIGCYVGLGAAIHPSLNAIDVGIVVKTDLITNKYTQRYLIPT